MLSVSTPQLSKATTTPTTVSNTASTTITSISEEAKSANNAAKRTRADEPVMERLDKARLPYPALIKVGIRCCKGRTGDMKETNPNTMCYYSTAWSHITGTNLMATIYCCGKRFSICDRDKATVMGLCCLCKIPIPNSTNVLQSMLLTTTVDYFGKDKFSDDMSREEPSLLLCQKCMFTPKLTDKKTEQMVLRSKNVVLSDDLRSDLYKAEEARKLAAQVVSDKKEADNEYAKMEKIMKDDIKGSPEEKGLIQFGSLASRKSLSTSLREFSVQSMNDRSKQTFKTTADAARWWMIRFLKSVVPKLEVKNIKATPVVKQTVIVPYSSSSSSSSSSPSSAATAAAVASVPMMTDHK